MKNGMKYLAVLALAASSGSAAIAQGDSAGDPLKGKKVFKKCQACHKVGDGAKNGIGPFLSNVIGRSAGTAEGYKYSKSLIAAGQNGLVWSEEGISQWVENPTAFLREYLGDSSAKSKMPLKVKKEKDRVNVAAYVATFSAPPAE